MRKRVVDDGAGGWSLVDNAGYRGRPGSHRTFARDRDLSDASFHQEHPPCLQPIRNPSLSSPGSPRRLKHAGSRDDDACARDRADPIFFRRHDGQELDHEGVPRLGETPRAR